MPWKQPRRTARPVPLWWVETPAVKPMQIKNIMRVRRRNHSPVYCAKQFAISGKRVTLQLGLSGLSHSNRILQRHGIAKQRNPISTVAAEKSIHAI